MTTALVTDQGQDLKKCSDNAFVLDNADDALAFDNAFAFNNALVFGIF